MNIWILEKNSGRTLLFKSFLDFKKDEILVSGLITALNQFTVSEFDDPIESIDMGGLRWIYLQELEINLLFVASDTKDINAEIIRARLEAIKKAFLEEYVIDHDFYNEDWDGNLDIFYPFYNILEKYYQQWTQAESVDFYAEFFDVLGVCQQTLNIINRIINKHVQEDQKELIYKKMEQIFEEFSRSTYVLENQELKKITFSKELGFNIIGINPQNFDLILMKTHLFQLIQDIIQTFKGIIGYESSLCYFGKENLYKYILNNIILLKRLNLDVFLFELFLINT